jgi:hypothetical protein
MFLSSTQIIIYIVLLVLICFSVLIYCYISNLNKINTEIAILQKDNPTESDIQDLLVQKQPTIFADVLYEWEAIAEIFDMPIDLITELLAAKPFVQLLTTHLEPYALLFSRGWKFNASERIPDPENPFERYFRLESHHRHFIAQITGIQRVYIASPNQTTFLTPVEIETTISQSPSHSLNKTRCTVDFYDEVATTKEPFSKLQYIEIVLREGNMLYIPRGWWYLQTVEAPGIVLEAVNESIFS